MAHQGSSPQYEYLGMSKKRLRKYKVRLQERLEKACKARADMEERLRRVQYRLQKKTARVARLEQRLALILSHLGELPAAEAVVEVVLSSAKPQAELSPVPPVSIEALELARQARAVAMAAEQAACLAVERALIVAERLDQLPAGRHLDQELMQVQAEADQACVFAVESERSAVSVEQLVHTMERTPSSDQPAVSEGEYNSTEFADRAVQECPMSVPEENQQERLDQQSEQITRPEPEIIQAIEEDEESVEQVAAMLISDAAAVAAAQAEAFAEASSARTREIRMLAKQADQMLATVQTAIQHNTLVGEEASKALQAAEREATHTHALLADAEASEEQAVGVAMNAEADAEVAEGMAFSSNQRWQRTSLRQDLLSQSLEDDQRMGEMNSEGDPLAKEVDLEDDTLKMPVVRPREAT